MKRAWRILKEGTPGDRFCRYHREHENRESPRFRLVQIAIAAILILVGLVLLVVPGPGILFLAVGAAILARESMAIAKLLDWMELRIRRILRR